MVEPSISETFIINEFDLLQKAGIEFRVSATKLVSKTEPKNLEKYKKYFFYLPSYRNDPFLLNVIRILYYHTKIFILYPIRYTRLFFWILFHYEKNYLRCFLRIGKVLPAVGKFNPDLVYSRYAKDALVSTFLTSKFFGTKFGIIYYSYYPKTSYMKHINSCISFIIAKTNYIKGKYLTTYSDLNPDKIKVLPWGIDTKCFKPSKEKTHKIFTILSISQFSEKKGLIYLAQSCKLLKKKNISFKCIIIGDGLERKKVVRYLKENKLTREVQLKEGIPHSVRFKRYMQSADVFVLPSIIDSKGEADVIPNVLLEAMAMEVPVITTRVGGMGEVITHGINGFLVKEKDEVILADMIKRVMDMPLVKRQKVGQKARETIIKYWDKEKLGKNFVEFLKSRV